MHPYIILFWVFWFYLRYELRYLQEQCENLFHKTERWLCEREQEALSSQSFQKSAAEGHFKRLRNLPHISSSKIDAGRRSDGRKLLPDRSLVRLAAGLPSNMPLLARPFRAIQQVLQGPAPFDSASKKRHQRKFIFKQAHRW